MGKQHSIGPFKLITDTISGRTDVPLDHYCRANAQCMAMTHNTIFRGFNSVYKHSRNVRPGTREAADMLLYCSVIYEFVHCHHTSEEMYYFPQLEEATGIPGLMEGNIQQHKMFEEGLEIFGKYAAETRPECYDPEKLRDIIDHLAGPLEEHLHDEIPNILDLHRVIDSKSLRRIYAKMHSECAKMSDKMKMAPYVFGCQDSEFLLDGQKVVFPEVLPIVPYIIALVIAPWHRSLWNFNPSDMHGQPQGMRDEFVGDLPTILTNKFKAFDIGLMLAAFLFFMIVRVQDL